MIFLLSLEKILYIYTLQTYNLNVMRQSLCLVFNPLMVDDYAAFFNCTSVGRASDSMMAPLKLLILVGWDRSSLSVGSTGVFRLLRIFSDVVRRTGQLIVFVSRRFLFILSLMIH